MSQKKPYPNFPLTLRKDGRYCCKIKGRIHYFGRDQDEALAKYRREIIDLEADRQPAAVVSDGVNLEYLISAFLDRSKKRVGANLISPVSLADHQNVAKLLTDHFKSDDNPEAIRPDQFSDFRFALKYSPARTAKIVVTTKSIFKFGIEAGLIQKMPNFGPDFKIPTKKEMRLHKAKQPVKLMAAAEIRAMLEIADPQLKAILLLSVNGGIGNADIGRLTVSHVGGAWLDFARGKTGIMRRIPLWPETQAALAPLIEGRGPEELLFRSSRGGPVISLQVGGSRTDLTSIWFKKCAVEAKVHRNGIGLYVLRHVFQTEGDEAGDPAATSAIMGHVDASMAAEYRGRGTRDERLLAVVNHVRAWLFADADPKPRD